MLVEVKTQKQFDKCIKGGDIAVVRGGVWEAYGNSTVTAYGNSTVTAYGQVCIRKFGGKIIMSTKSCVIIEPIKIKGLDDFLSLYPAEKKGKSIYLFKAVNVDMVSSRNMEYPKKGVVTNDKLDPPEYGSCANGLHFAHFDWAVRYGMGEWDKFKILKARIPITNPKTKKDNIVVASDCDGKLRCQYAEIVEVIDDWQHYNPY